MFQNSLEDLGAAALNFVQRLGEIAVVSLIYFGIAYILIRVILRRVKHSALLNRYGKDGSMIAFRLISVTVYLIAAVGVLSYAGVNTNGILTLMSAFTVAIGLALQDVMRNLIAGLFMLAERPFSVGDRVIIRSRLGTVQGIDIRTTMLRTDEGELLMVPNQIMFSDILQNNTRYNMRLLKYRITSNLPQEELMAIVSDATKHLESIRPPLATPILIQHNEEKTEWELHFAVSARKMTNDFEVGEALIKALPTAVITRVTV